MKQPIWYRCFTYTWWTLAILSAGELTRITRERLGEAMQPLLSWLFRGVHLDSGVTLCAAVVVIVLWIATRSDGRVRYPRL